MNSAVYCIVLRISTLIDLLRVLAHKSGFGTSTRDAQFQYLEQIMYYLELVYSYTYTKTLVPVYYVELIDKLQLFLLICFL